MFYNIKAFTFRPVFMPAHVDIPRLMHVLIILSAFVLLLVPRLTIPVIASTG